MLPSALTGQTPVDTAAAIRAAHTATQTWLALVDSGQVAKGWEQAATSLQRAQPTAAFAQSVLSARSPFEPFGARRRFMAQYVAQVPNAPPGQYVVLQYSTSVAGDRRVIETVVAHFDGERGWRVHRYAVSLDPDHRDSITERRRADSAESRRFLIVQQVQVRAIREASRRCRESAGDVESALRRHRDFNVQRAGARIIHGEFLVPALQAIAAGDSNQACVPLIDSIAGAMTRHRE